MIHDWSIPSTSLHSEEVSSPILVGKLKLLKLYDLVVSQVRFTYGNAINEAYFYEFELQFVLKTHH